MNPISMYENQSLLDNFKSLRKLQLLAALFFVVGKLIGVVACGLVIISVFYSNFKPLAIGVLVAYAIFIMASVVLCLVDQYKNTKQTKKENLIEQLKHLSAKDREEVLDTIK